MSKGSMARKSVLLWVLALIAVAVLPGCDGRLIAAGHVTSLGVSVALFWATLNLDKVR